MREILFRGKRLDNGEWIENDCIIHLKERNTVYISAHKEEVLLYGDDSLITKIENCMFFGIDPKTIGQYTGLTDKNGVKIFEGDILEVRYGSETHYCSVKYDERTAQFVFDYGRRGVSKVEDLLSGVVFMVIGNIYENPELLKKS